jgi:hypothetical protein
MLSSALMAVLITATPAHRNGPARPVAQSTSTCSARWLDPKFVHFVEKAPSEKDAPGLRLVTQTSTTPPLITAGPSSCVTYLTRLDLAR